MALDKDALLNKSKHFCILPWVHYHVSPGGHVCPCCVGHDERGSHSFGDINKTGFEEIWQGETIRNFRKNLIEDKPHPECEYCYFMERSGINSFRQRFLTQFGEKHFFRVESTEENGFAKDAKPVYWDVRFSNICNLTCRMCEHTLSSSWHKECKLMKEYFIESSPDPIIKGVEDTEKFFTEMEPYWEGLEELYFAGGEPLMMHEHHRTLQKLISENRTEIPIRYNTNFTKRFFKGTDIFELWSKFDNITVHASLDAMGDRAEYVRNGCKWDEILKNREALREIAPNVTFKVYPTVTILNIHQLTDMHRTLVESNFIEINNFVVSYLLFPHYLNIRVLPEHLKKEVREKFAAHKEWIKERINPDDFEDHMKNWDVVLEYLDEDWSEKVHDFIHVTHKIDDLRDHTFKKTFPELSSLYNECPDYMFR